MSTACGRAGAVGACLLLCFEVGVCRPIEPVKRRVGLRKHSLMASRKQIQPHHLVLHGRRRDGGFLFVGVQTQMELHHTGLQLLRVTEEGESSMANGPRVSRPVRPVQCKGDVRIW